MSKAEEARAGVQVPIRESGATIKIQLIGVSDLLMNNPAKMERSGGGARTKKIPTPEEEAEASAYRNAAGELVMPATAVRSSVISGGKFQKIGRYGAQNVMSAYLLLTAEWFPVLAVDGKPIVDYEIDSRRAVVQRAGIIRCRAKVKAPWVIEAEFEVNEELDLKVEDVEKMIATAGRLIGLGDYRIEKKGWFGAYRVGSVNLAS